MFSQADIKVNYLQAFGRYVCVCYISWLNNSFNTQNKKNQRNNSQQQENTTRRRIKETIHFIKTENYINGISYKLPDIWLPAIKVKHDGNTQTENNRQNSPNRVHWGPQFQKPAKNLLMVRIGPNSTHIRFHPPNHLPEDERSFSRNVTSLKT